MKRRFLPWLSPALAAALLLPAAASAGTCTITSSTGINFGNYMALDTTPVTATGSITVSCTGSGKVIITLSTGSGGSYNPRSMAGPSSDRLNYYIYKDVALTKLWGDGTSGTTKVSRNYSNNSKTATAYGKIPSGQNVAIGAYSDIIIVTASF